MSVAARALAEAGRRGRGLVVLGAVLAAWAALTHGGAVPPELLPSPGAVGATFLRILGSGELARSLGASLVRIAEGFALGAAVGFLLGGLMGLSRTAERMIAPLFDALRQVPLLGWAPLIILWCGISDASKIVFIAIGAVIPMALNTFEGIRSVASEHVEVGRVFEARPGKLLRKVILPGAMPKILSGVRLSLGTAWMLVVWAEASARSARGIGDMLWSAREASRIDVVIVCVVVIGVAAYLTNALVGALEARLLRWRPVVR